MQLLGIDNVFFNVSDITQAISYYESLGFKLKFKIPQIAGALFCIGEEEPGLILQETDKLCPSQFWVEVRDAYQAEIECKTLKINGNMLETATGFTFEISDPWENRIGFADYTKKPTLARRQSC